MRQLYNGGKDKNQAVHDHAKHGDGKENVYYKKAVYGFVNSCLLIILNLILMIPRIF